MKSFQRMFEHTRASGACVLTSILSECFSLSIDRGCIQAVAKGQSGSSKLTAAVLVLNLDAEG